ncbi:hypothetical protein [Epilithonimonas sp.]|uniref:hypothetical protein n=1 Tax=Epilithonimonas sp. TaxID=2894511 RepID=UPI0035B4F0AD
MIIITIQSVPDADYFKFKQAPAEFFDSKAKHYELYRNSASNEDSETLLVSARNVTNRDYLFSNVAVESIEVDGEVYGSFEDLADVLAPILFKKGGGTGGGGTGNVWETDLFLAYPLGKYSAGMTVATTGKTNEEIIRDAYQGVLDAVIVNPSFSLIRDNISNIVAELGSTVNINLTGTYNPGGIYGKIISNNWQTTIEDINKQANRAGNIVSMTIDGEVFTDLVNPKTKNINRIINLGPNTFNGSVTFLQGYVRPKRSDETEYGTIYTTPLTIVSSTSTITGLVPYFYGFINDNQTIDDINLSTLTKVIASSTGTISIPFSNVIGKKLVVLTPSTSTTKTKWFINSLNNGNIGNNGDLFPNVYTRSYTSPEIPTPLWADISFKVYISTVTNINTSIQLQN